MPKAFSLRWPRLACLCLAAAAVGCSAGYKYIYEPEQNDAATVAGRPAALYMIPPAAPQGSLRIATIGIATFKLRRDSDSHFHAAHVRYIVANNGQVPWSVDTRAQIASVSGAGTSRPAYVNTNGKSPPIVQVPPHSKVTLDFFYPLPSNMQDASEVPQLDIAWRIATPLGELADRTSFARVRLEPAYPPFDYGWGFYDYYDPLWPNYAFGPSMYLGPEVFASPAVAPPATPVR